MTRFRNLLFAACSALALAASPALAQQGAQLGPGGMGGMMGGSMMGQQSQQPAPTQDQQAGQQAPGGGMNGSARTTVGIVASWPRLPARSRDAQISFAPANFAAARTSAGAACGSIGTVVSPARIAPK